jgi:hypothetical protein
VFPCQEHFSNNKNNSNKITKTGNKKLPGNCASLVPIALEKALK